MLFAHKQVWNTDFSSGAGKNEWTTPGNHNIMLNADMAVGFDISIGANNLAPPTQRCGATSGPGRAFGCSNPVATTKPSTYTLAASFAANNAAFLSAFATSYTKMTTVGYGVPAATDGATSTGKLGTVTSIDFSTC
jgi:hypothetical protein